jgi:hypothetical protein
VTHCKGRVINTEYLGDGVSESLVEMTGVSQNTVSAFDGMQTHCLMRSAIINGKPSVSGACTETDVDGDHVFASFDGAAYKLTGGTGKYQEFSGSAVYSVMPDPPHEQGAIRLCDEARRPLDDSSSAAGWVGPEPSKNGAKTAGGAASRTGS